MQFYKHVNMTLWIPRSLPFRQSESDSYKFLTSTIYAISHQTKIEVVSAEIFFF